MRNLQTLNLLPVLALASLFIKISGSVSLRPVLSGPDMAYLGSRVAFRCIASDIVPPVFYELKRDGGGVISTYVDNVGDQPAPLFMKVTATSEGSYHCKATSGGETGVSNIIKLSVVTPASNTWVTSDPSPPVAYEGSRIVLSCNVTRGSHLSFSWFFNRKEVTPSTSPFFHLAGNQLIIEKVTPEHAGYYSCMAWSMVQDIRRFSSSSELQVTVKVYVLKPKISFSMSKEGTTYQSNITCWSTQGSYPVNFTLLIDGKDVASITATESLTVWFPFPMAPGRDMGVAQCRVRNEVQELLSEPVTLLVVPVGGDARVEVEYLFRADSNIAAVRLSCKASKGTFPYISWSLNNSALPTETHTDSHIQRVLPYFALSDQRRTLVITKLGPEESGYYRCRVRDSYDESGPWVESPAMLVKAEGVFMSTVEVVAIAFCCFLILMMAVFIIGAYKMFDHIQAHTHVGMTNYDDLSQFDPLSLSGGQQAHASSTGCDVQRQFQTRETTV